MYKALIADIDGTVGEIGTDGSDITQSAKDAVAEAKSKGKVIAFATGRRWITTKPVVENLGISDPCIILGGSTIIDPVTEKILWEKILSPKDTLLSLEIVKRIATSNITSEILDKSKVPMTMLANADGANSVIYVMGLDTDTTEKLLEAINETKFAIAHKTSPSWYGSEYTDVHITNPDASKEHAINEWLKLLRLAKEETIGLGDSENDLPLFNSVGLKVVVRNAHQNLKVHADKIVPSYNEGGFELTIRQILLKK